MPLRGLGTTVPGYVPRESMPLRSRDENTSGYVLRGSMPLRGLGTAVPGVGLSKKNRSEDA